MNCPRCRSEYSEDSNYCKVCGYKLDSGYDEMKREYNLFTIAGFILVIFSILRFNLGSLVLNIIGIILSKLGMDESEGRKEKDYKLGKIGFNLGIGLFIIKILGIIIVSLLFLDMIPSILMRI